MKTIKLGVDFIDNHLNQLDEKGIFLLSAGVPSLRILFQFNVIAYNLRINQSCLYISHIEKFFQNIRNIDRVVTLLNNNMLSVLEIPSHLPQYIKNYNDLAHCLDDLKIYIDNIKPNLIVFDNPEIFVNEGKNTINTTYLSYLMNFLFDLDVAVLMDVINFDTRSIHICEKYVSGIIELYDEEKSDTYQLVIDKLKTGNEKLNLTFSLDSQNNFIVPKSKISLAIAFDECKQIVMHSSLIAYEPLFVEIFKTELEFLYFETLPEFSELKIDYKYSLIILPALIQNFSGWKALSYVRRNYPFCKVLFSGSMHTPASQKVRAIKMGAYKFITYPMDKESLQTALNDMYQYEEVEQTKEVQHNIIFTSGDLIKKYLHQSVHKNILFKLIKEYVYSLITQGLTVQFYKISIDVHSINKVHNEIIKHTQIVFASTYYVEKKQYIMMIYNNLNFESIGAVQKTISAINNQQAEVINYPLDETDIDIVLEWLYV